MSRLLVIRCLRRAAPPVAAAVVLALAAAHAGANPYGSPGGLTDAQSGTGGLGAGVAICGDGSVAVVGEPNYNGGAGAALIYTNSNGAWSFAQKLTPTGEMGAAHFGAAVSIDRWCQTVVIGGPDDSGGVGSAWAFALTNGTWTQQGQLFGGGAEIGAGRFGASVAVASAGMLALVGAPMSNNGQGQAFTFNYDSQSGWYRFQRMDLQGVVGAAHFGASVALKGSGGGALVGAPNMSNGDGAIFPYSYFGLESPYWIDEPAITSPATGGHFGASVAISLDGQLELAGAPAANNGDGGAWIYRINGVLQAHFSDPAGSTGGNFGTSVAFADESLDQVLVGAPGDNAGAGAAYDFDAANGANWLTDGAAVAPAAPPVVGDAYGSSVAVADNASAALVGAPGAGAGDGAAVHFVSALITAPTQPLGVQALAGAESVAVTWAPPASTGGAPITGYTVTAAPGGLQCATAGLTCTVNGLTDGQQYTFTVTATNGHGTGPASDPSAAVTPIGLPGSPGSVQAVAGAESAAVTWVAPLSTGGSAITGYTVTAAPGGLQCASAGLRCTVSGLTDGQQYTFTVTATNAAGTGPASAASNAVTPQAGAPQQGGGAQAGGGSHGGGGGGVQGGGGGAGLPGIGGGTWPGGGGGGGALGGGGQATPGMPRGPVRLTRVTRTSLTFTWLAPANPGSVVGYRVYELHGTSWIQMAGTDARTRTFTRARLRHRSRRQFAVRAVDGSGNLSAPLLTGWLGTR